VVIAIVMKVIPMETNVTAAIAMVMNTIPMNTIPMNITVTLTTAIITNPLYLTLPLFCPQASQSVSIFSTIWDAPTAPQRWNGRLMNSQE
jgi:hypothetical protein